MSDRLGPISFDDSSHSVFIGRDFSQTKSYSEETAAIIDEEVKGLFDKAQAECERILTEHKNLLIAVAEYLLENENMEADVFNYVCSHNGQLPPAADSGEGQNTAEAAPEISMPTVEPKAPDAPKSPEG